MEPREDLHITARPPEGWIPSPIKLTAKTIHQIWISSDRQHGVWGDLREAAVAGGAGIGAVGVHAGDEEGTRGRQNYWTRRAVDHLNGVRFKARGKLYSIDAILYAEGWDCWIAYAGQYSDKQADAKEMAVAKLASERVVMGKP